jgi:dipeptidyl aminopeptidase/acylaminoacyl peptidase
MYLKQFTPQKRKVIAFCLCFLITIVSSQLKAQIDKGYIPDIAAFMQVGLNDEPQHCVKTGELFFEGKMSGARQVHRLDETGWPYQLTTFENGVDWYKISHDGKKAIVGASTGGSEQSQLFLMDTKHGQLKKLTNKPDKRFGSVFWKKDGRGFYYRSNFENSRDFKIYYHDLNNGESTKILDMEGSNSIGDLSYDGKYMIVYHYISNIANDLFLLDLNSGEFREITPADDEAEYTFPSISRDNKTLYIITDNTADGLRRLAKIDMETDSMKLLNPDSKWNADILKFSENRKYMVWTTNQDGYSSLKIMDLEKDETLPIPFIRGRIKHLYPIDDGRLALAYDSPTRTADIWMWNPDGSEMVQKTFATYSGLDRESFVEPILIKYKSFDGLEIPAFLYLPPNRRTNEPPPFIIYAHGGPENQFRPYFIRNLQYFALNGFGILAPNVRGSDGYGRDYLNMDNYKNRHKSVKDYKAAADYLINEMGVSTKKLGIMGGSYGGYIVLACLSEYPEVFSAGVERMGIANFVTFLEKTKSYRRHIRETEYGPLTDSEFLESISPVHNAFLIRAPLLIIHGENDSRVPVGEARQIIQAIENNDGIIDSLIFPDEGHQITKRSNMIEAYRKTAAHFAKYLRDWIN